MSVITKIHGRQVFDSRGFPTAEAEVHLSCGAMGRSIVPSGASTGAREALELRDGDKLKYHGKGVAKAVSNINNILADEVVGLEIDDLSAIDTKMISLDGTSDKSRLGANSVLAVSLASAVARANSRQKWIYEDLATGFTPIMPVPLFNVVNGGKHADNNVDIQEFMIVPNGASSFEEAMQIGTEIYHVLKSVLKQKNLNTAVGDEGGFAPDLRSNEEAINIILEAIEHSAWDLGKHISLALDCAASEYYEDGHYHLTSEGKKLSSAQMTDLLASWVRQYPIISIEDGMDENDRQGWAMLTEACGHIQLVGDDLFVTNPNIFRQGIKDKLGNSILIKVNQIGTLSETIETIKIAQQSGYSAVMSHRSGETEDCIIADLAVAFGVGQIKTGAPCRSDRMAKYNQLLRIAEHSGFPYAGNDVFKRR